MRSACLCRGVPPMREADGQLRVTCAVHFRNMLRNDELELFLMGKSLTVRQ